MPMLPIPAFIAFVLAYLALRTFMADGRPMLVVFLLVCALQSSLVTLVGGYDIDLLMPVMPVSATLIPPLAWITLQDALIRQRPWPAILAHGAAPAFTLFCRLFAPGTVDFVVPLVFLGYGGAILFQLRGTSDTPLARLEAGQTPSVIWQALGWALIASALIDALIAVAFFTGHESWIGWLVAASSSLVLLVLGVLSCSPSASGEVDDEPTRRAPRQSDEEDSQIIEKLEAFLAHEPLHLDPNLTLSRLSRRLLVPEKRLSAAVNRATGANVSRYINGWRIRHACRLIEDGTNVTNAMLASGFNTKSNFNREFLRETGVNPSNWLKDRSHKSSGQTHTNKAGFVRSCYRRPFP